MSRRCLALTRVFALCAAAAAARGYAQPLTVRSYDPAPVESATLNRAQAFVEHVFARAGVPLVWRWCAADDSPECATAGGPNDIRLRIVRRSEALEAATGEITGGRALRGRAGQQAGTIEVFEDRLEALSRDLVPDDLALGVVLTHEIGHLLLPPGHSSLGIMKKLITERDWVEAARGALRFTPQEYRAIRQRVQPRRVPLELCPSPPGLGAL
jgi:hypothetical protein